MTFVQGHMDDCRFNTQKAGLEKQVLLRKDDEIKITKSLERKLE